MKRLLYRVFALICNFYILLLPQQKTRAVFLSMHNEDLFDSLGAVREHMEKLGFQTVVLSRRDLEAGLRRPLAAFRFFFVRTAALARAKYVFLNDTFMPLGLIRFHKDTEVVQLWHAEGVFKKFGLAIPQPPQVRQNELAGCRKLTAVVCSSKAAVPYYAEAFGISEDRVLPLGAPRADRLFRPGAEKEAKEALLEHYPALRGKKLVLWAPTFRDDEAADKTLPEQFDFAAFEARFGQTHALLVRLHPQIHAQNRTVKDAVDVTDYLDPTALVLAADMLITDYSSICMDFALLGKPCVFFAFDLAAYKAARDFYFDYESYVPGIVAQDFPALLSALETPPQAEKLDRFRRFNFDFFDSENTDRVVRAILEKNQKKA